MLLTHVDGAGVAHSRSVRVNVFAFPPISLSVADATLNRFGDEAGNPIAASGCASAGNEARPYQRTRIAATVVVDSVTYDISPLARFETGDTSVARVARCNTCVLESSVQTLSDVKREACVPESFVQAPSVARRKACVPESCVQAPSVARRSAMLAY